MAEQESSVDEALGRPWKLLIVDDEPAIHDITVLTLDDLELDGYPLEFLHAFSRAEAEVIIGNTPDIALALIDVVMETEDAGLELVHWVRKTFHNQEIRLVLRTGQPGEAPVREIIRNYDINDYREKTELHINALRALVFGSLRSYRDILNRAPKPALTE